ncbi:MAG: sensor histidine kinase [Caldilineaceae bacterium]
MNDSTLERGLLGAFRFFIAIRLLLWLLLYLGDADIAARPAFDALGVQIFVITFIPDLLMLIALLWPPAHPAFKPWLFKWFLVVSTMVLLFGHAGVLSLRDMQSLPNPAAYFTPYTLFLFTTALFVGWQYDFRAVLLYGGAVISALVLLLCYFGTLTVDRGSVTIAVGLLTILLPGWLITRMMTQQRQQRAALAAAAAEQARTNEKLVHYAASLEELTISRERNRLARELHDTLAHSLSAVTVQLGAVETLWASSPDAAKSLLAQADASARQGLEEARRALQALRASPLEDLGLVLALAALAQEAAARAGATLHLALPEDNLSFLEPYIEQSIYRVAQEALENCVRHAEAKTLGVKLTHSAELIQLMIRDDGQGFDQSLAAQRGHYGLAGIAERASVISGTLTIESARGEGATIQLTVSCT